MVGQITINDFSSTPKYVQIANSIIHGIRAKAMYPGQKLPSITELCIQLEVSKNTVELAYERLKEQEIIQGVQGKGFYINYSKIGQTQKVFLLFNKLSEHKKIVYDAFVDQLGTDSGGHPVPVDLFIYNNDFAVFKHLLLSHLSGYTHYVIIPHFYSHHEQAAHLLNRLPQNKLILLDKYVEGVTGHYGSVVQNFEKDLSKALTDALPLLRKYSTLNILFPRNTYQPRAILNGFYAFCHEHGFQANVVSDVSQHPIQAGHAYINLMEEDLVMLVKKIKASGFRVGQEVGILSYNETPLKEILLDGITVISTDFEQMGRTAADLIRADKRQHLENPFRLIRRNSL